MWECTSTGAVRYMVPLPVQSHSFDTPKSATILLTSESLMGSLPVRCFEKLEASIDMRLANSDWVIPKLSIRALILSILALLFIIMYVVYGNFTIKIWFIWNGIVYLCGFITSSKGSKLF